MVNVLQDLFLNYYLCILKFLVVCVICKFFKLINDHVYLPLLLLENLLVSKASFAFVAFNRLSEVH